MGDDFKSVRLKISTWEKLTILKAWTGKTIWELAEIAIEKEYEKIKAEKGRNREI